MTGFSHKMTANNMVSTKGYTYKIGNQPIPLPLTIYHQSCFHLDLFRFPLCVFHLIWTFGYYYKLNSIELKFIQKLLPFCPYCFAHTILSIPFCPIPFCSLPFCPVTLEGQLGAGLLFCL